VTGNAPLDLVVTSVLLKYNPSKVTIVTSNPAVTAKVLEIWEARWTRVETLVLAGEAVLPRTATTIRLCSRLTKLHVTNAGIGSTQDVIHEVFTNPNSLRLLRVRNIIEVDMFESALASPHCQLSFLGLAGRNVDRMLDSLHVCTTLNTLELHYATEEQLRRMASLIERNRFPLMLCEIVMTSWNSELLREGCGQIKEAHRQRRGSQLLLNATSPVKFF
jgi:hypothetical protein